MTHDIENESKELTLHTITIMLNALKEAYDHVDTGSVDKAVPYMRYAAQASTSLAQSLQEFLMQSVTYELVDEGYRDLVMQVLGDDDTNGHVPGQYM